MSEEINQSSAEILSGDDFLEEEFEVTLRPKKFSEYIGQNDTKEHLSIAIEAARKRKEPVEHLILYGPPGLGKTMNSI